MSALREKCPSTEFFLVLIFPYSVRVRENTEQKKLHIGHFSYGATAADNAFERGSCEIACYEKSSISIFKESFASIDKDFWGEEDWTVGYDSMKFWHKSFGNSWGKSHIPVYY